MSESIKKIQDFLNKWKMWILIPIIITLLLLCVRIVMTDRSATEQFLYEKF